MDKRIAMIGTAGWSVPREEAARFPGTGSHLARYSAVMPAAEINTSFYRPHRRATYERWAATVPDGFRFAVKVPRTITHDGRLAVSGDLVGPFLDQVGGLGRKLGVLLVQLPPSLAFDAARADAFFADVRLRTDTPLACEPRHQSWFSPPAEACLAAHGVARVVADPVLAPGGERPGGWNGLRYRRLHGAPRVYYSDYDAPALARIAAALDDDLAAGAEAWCIFDNTAAFAALRNARDLKALMEAPRTAD
jgi:uncharacterized protein YecE (DUF72 family)